MSNDYTPAVISAPGVVASDGGDKLFSPRNLIALLIILAFAFEIIAPYALVFPKSIQAQNMVLTTSKTVESVVMLVLAFFFGTTVNANKQADTIRQQALAAPLSPQMLLAGTATKLSPIQAAPDNPDDDKILAEMKAMVANGVGLDSAGVPNLAILNARLQTKGVGPIDASHRDLLMHGV